MCSPRGSGFVGSVHTSAPRLLACPKPDPTPQQSREPAHLALVPTITRTTSGRTLPAKCPPAQRQQNGQSQGGHSRKRSQAAGIPTSPSHLNLPTLTPRSPRPRLALGTSQDEILGQEEPSRSVLGLGSLTPPLWGPPQHIHFLVLLLALLTPLTGPGYTHISLISNKLNLQSIIHFPKINLGAAIPSSPSKIK